MMSPGVGRRRRVGWEATFPNPSIVTRDSSTMNAILGIGAAAGLVSGLLFSAVISGKAIAFALYFVAPLPVLLAALGWNHRAGLAAAVAGSLFVALVFTPAGGFAYAASVALPAWWYGYLALLARTEGEVTQWYPLGRLLLWISGISAALTLVAAMLLGGDYDAFVAAFARVVEVIQSINPDSLKGLSPEAQAKSATELAQLLAIVAPPISAAVGVAIAVLLLWVAAKVTQASGRLPRPWPDLAATTLPPAAMGLLGAGVVASLVLDGFAGVGVRSLAAAMVMAFALQGLATLHVLTRGVGGRVGILSAVYVTLVVLPGWPVLLYAVIGLLDALAGLRARKLAAGRPTRPSS
jgi:hypothetical protein